MASDDSKKQPGVLMLFSAEISLFLLSQRSFNKCLHWECLHRAAVWGTFLLPTQVLFSL